MLEDEDVSEALLVEALEEEDVSDALRVGVPEEEDVSEALLVEVLEEDVSDALELCCLLPELEVLRLDSEREREVDEEEERELCSTSSGKTRTPKTYPSKFVPTCQNCGWEPTQPAYRCPRHCLQDPGIPDSHVVDKKQAIQNKEYF